MKKKSAIEVSTLVLYIILISTTLTLAGAVTLYTRLASKDLKKRACEWDILKATLSKDVFNPEKLGTKGHRMLAIKNCRRDKLGNLEIKYKDVVEDGLINQEKASKMIADEIAACWVMVGQGLRDPFTNWDNDDSAYCMMCSTIKFGKKLQDYYRDSLGDKKIGKKRGDKGLIQHPIPWMTENEYKKTGKTYYEFVYKTKPQYNTQELIDMEKQFVTEDTAILLKLYKYKDKDTWTVIARAGTIIVGLIMFTVGVLLTATFVGSIIGVPLKVGAIILIGGVAVTIGGTAAWQAGIAMFDPVNVNPYSECEECQGVGSIKIIPPQFDISQKVIIEYPLNNGEDKIREEGPYCKIVVN